MRIKRQREDSVSYRSTDHHPDGASSEEEEFHFEISCKRKRLQSCRILEENRLMRGAKSKESSALPSLSVSTGAVKGCREAERLSQQSFTPIYLHSQKGDE